MLAAAKVDTLEYVEFDGIHDEYPNWFMLLFKDHLIWEEYGSVLYFSETYGDLAVSNGDVFLLNKFGNVMFVNRQDFTELYYDVN